VLPDAVRRWFAAFLPGVAGHETSAIADRLREVVWGQWLSTWMGENGMLTLPEHAMSVLWSKCPIDDEVSGQLMVMQDQVAAAGGLGN
jgi:hypothetical protein